MLNHIAVAVWTNGRGRLALPPSRPGSVEPHSCRTMMLKTTKAISVPSNLLPAGGICFRVNRAIPSLPGKPRKKRKIKGIKLSCADRIAESAFFIHPRYRFTGPGLIQLCITPLHAGHGSTTNRPLMNLLIMAEHQRFRGSSVRGAGFDSFANQNPTLPTESPETRIGDAKTRGKIYGPSDPGIKITT